MKRILGGVLIVVFGAYSLGLLWLYSNQRSLQYLPSHKDVEKKGSDHFFPWVSRSGDFIGYARTPGKWREVVLFFHGNSGEALDREWFSKLVGEDQVLFLVEYPGFGARPGEPSQELFFRAAEQAFDEASGQVPLPILVVGESLGTGVACYLAAHRSVKRLGLISPFSSAVDVGAYRYPFVPVHWLMKDPFPSTEYAKKIEVPAHVVHGTDDTVVPLEQAHRLVAAFRTGQAALTELPGEGHNVREALTTDPQAEPFRAFLRGSSE